MTRVVGSHWGLQPRMSRFLRDNGAVLMYRFHPMDANSVVYTSDSIVELFPCFGKHKMIVQTTGPEPAGGSSGSFVSGCTGADSSWNPLHTDRVPLDVRRDGVSTAGATGATVIGAGATGA